jgi:putative phage-type endonuclease
MNFIDDDFSTLLQLYYDFIVLNPSSISDPNFEEIMIEEVISLLEITISDEDYIMDLIEESLPLFYEVLYPSRQEKDTYCREILMEEKMIINDKLEKINNIEQPAQKTPEWYDFRNNLLTASNAYKIFESQAQQNSLIYEKCVTKSRDDKNYVNTESSLHWGQKYEPLSILIYETIYKTTIKEYGCLRHDKYSFLGASPDGINVDLSSNRFGRLLEVKNIVNREITGIPKKEYWIQMQLQMETFDINECDFLETKFIEYTDEIEFLRDTDDNIFISKEGEQKGIILFFLDTISGKPIYIYSNVNMSYKEFELWSNDKIEKILKENEHYIWVKQIYWKLNEIRCVLVKRNKKWFQDMIPIITDFWDIIKKERIDGFEHRKPKSRISI